VRVRGLLCALGVGMRGEEREPASQCEHLYHTLDRKRNARPKRTKKGSRKILTHLAPNTSAWGIIQVPSSST